MLKKAALGAVLLLLAASELYLCTVFMPFHRQESYPDFRAGDGLCLLAIFMSFVLVAAGASGFVSPEALQDYALRQNSKWFPKNPFMNWMKTASYVRFLRLVGIIVYIAGLFAVFVLLKRLCETAFI